jgi:MOSC domain-containing protein YiiM
MDIVTGTLLSLQVGLPQTYQTGDHSDSPDRSWTTGIFKYPVESPVWLGWTNLTGDGQADLRVHGGPEKAVNAYPASHYPHWREELHIPDLPFGAFGENFTLETLNEQNVCIGDLFQIGEAQIQVSQPRQPCWKLARKWGLPELPALVLKIGFTGWYYRVVMTGYVQAGQQLVLLERRFPEWTIATANEIMYHRCDDPEATAALAACQLLSPNWRKRLAVRSSGPAPTEPHVGTTGP